MLDWRWQKPFSLNLRLSSHAPVTSAHSFRLGIHMRALPHAPDVELALPHETQAPGLQNLGAQGVRDRMRSAMSINTPLNSAMIVLDNKSLGKECFPFWMFDFLHSLHHVYRNFIPVVESKHKSSDRVGNHFMTFAGDLPLFTVSHAQAWKDLQT
jgi:hypothetical protein